MSDVVLYIAATLDGFIASSDGGIDWLKPFEQAGEDYGYAAFHARVGAVIIGGNTYRQALGFGEWPYAGVTTWVATRRGLAGERHPGADVRAFAGDMSDLVALARRETARDIWLVGGAQLVTAFVNQGLIDEFIIGIVPLVLGEGIPLFAGISRRTTLRLVETRGYASGIAQMTYRRAYTH